jgi:hypothetical protein
LKFPEGFFLELRLSENMRSAQPMETSDVPKVMDPRRHDLDALRAFAMLLGIGLHSALSFFQVPWPVQDIHQHKFFGIFMQAVHGFRMPLFFLYHVGLPEERFKKPALATHR